METKAGSELDPLVRRWVAAGIITQEQGDRIRADVSAAGALPPGPATLPPPTAPLAQPPPTAPVAQPPVAGPSAAPSSPLLAEGLGYLGGAVILVASSFVTAQFWSDMSTLARVLFAGLVAVALLVAGALVPSAESPSGARLRAVLWFGSTVAVGAFLGLLGAEALGWKDAWLAVFITGGAALYAAATWWVHRHPLQHVATFLATMGVLGSLAATLPDQSGMPLGLAVWGGALAWGLLAWGGLLPPAELGRVLGAFGLTVGAMVTMSEAWGNVLGLLTVIGLVVLAMLLRDLAMLAVATLGALQVLPASMIRFFPGIIGAALALLAAGLLLVVAALYVARHRRTEPEWLRRRDFSQGSPRQAVAAAGTVCALVAAVVVATGATV